MNTNNSILELPIEELVPNKFNPRIVFDDDSLIELAESIKNHGIIQPIVVRQIENKYEIIAGERRYRASKIAGLLKIPAVVTKLNEKQIAELSIVENIQRRSLNPMEEAKSYRSLLDEGLMDREELARKMGLASTYIDNKLTLLNLSVEVQSALLNNKISERHARTLLKITNPTDQNKYLAKVLEERLTVKSLEDLLKKAGIKKLPTKKDLFNDKRVETTFFNQLETEVVNMNIEEEPTGFVNLKEEKQEEIEVLGEVMKEEEIETLF